MTGPEHYREAERVLAAMWEDFFPDQTAERQVYLAAAQVHATLALAAATVADRGIGPEESSGWRSFHADEQWREVSS